MLGRNSTCDVCEAGKYSSPANQRGALTCEWCGIGLAAPAGSGNCTTCGNGGFAVLGASACGVCTAGTFAVAPASACTNCGVGFYAATGATTCTSCLSGQYAAGGSSSACTACPAGTFATGLVSACSTCAIGMYASQMGATACQNCSTCAVGQYNVSNCDSSVNGVCGTCSDPIRSDHASQGRFYFTGPGFMGPSSCPWYCTRGYGYTNNGCWYCTGTSWCLYGVGHPCPANSGNAPAANYVQTTCKCNAGYYGNGGWSDTWLDYPVGTQTQPPANWSGVNCETCPAGKYNTGTGFLTSAGCVSCVAGTYSTGTAMGTSATCVSCRSGTYSTGNGMINSSACQNCSVCQIGQYNVSNCNSSVNTVCGACTNLPSQASHTNAGFSGPTSCPWMCNPSYYQLPAGLCQVCPVGYWCMYGTLNQCPANSWFTLAWNPSQANCKCNAGYYGVGGWNYSWQLYPNGFMVQPPANWSGVNCESCQAGKYNTGTGATMSSLCTSCITGTYSTTLASINSGSCISCLPGTYLTGTAMMSSGSCISCLSGTYSTGAGMTASSVCRNCSVCQTGQYNKSNCNSSADIVCGNCSNPLQANQSARYYFTGLGYNGPSSCPWCCRDGLTYDQTSNGCLDLRPGHGWAQCGIRYNCPDGSNTFQFNIENQSACICNPGRYGVGGWSSNIPLMRGQISPPANWSGRNCELCPKGTYITGYGFTSSAACILCDAGKFSIIPGAFDPIDCFSCSPGSYSTGLGQSSFSTCTACPSGTYSSSGYGMTSPETCTPCQPGTYSTGIGMTASSKCTNCSVCQTGQYNVSNCNSSANIVCGNCSLPVRSDLANRFVYTGVGYNGDQSCPWCCNAGFFLFLAAYGSHQCIGIGISASWTLCGVRYYCPANSRTNTLTAGSQTACTCNAGYFGVGGWNNTWQNFPTGIQLQPPANWSGVNCQSCQTGKYNTGSGVTMSSLCTSCITGTYSTVLASPNSSTCLSCQSGTYQTATGASNSSQCTLCHAGTYFTGAGAITSLTCQTCLPGKFSTSLGAFDASTCQNCEAGTFATISGAVSSSICSSCAAGTFAASSGSVNCSGCLSGTFSLTRASACDTCSLGTFSNGQASTCTACQPGYFALDGAPSCTPCPPGSFNERNGSSNCSLCEAGLYSYAGMSACSKCPAGTYKQFEACYNCLSPEDDCQPCFPGSASTMLGRSTQCDWCKAGTYSYPPNTFGALTCQTCENGTVASYDGAQECSVCVLGKYAPANSSACLDCPFHTYLEQQYKGSVLDCQACGPGTFSFFSGVPSRFACIGCSAGTYESSRDCIECPSGTFTPQDTFTSCIDCNVGKFAPGLGNTWCQICPLGKFTPAQSSACQDCPFHTYLDIGYKASVLDCLPCPAGTYSLNLAASSPLLCTPCLRGTYELNRLCLACASGTYSSGAQATACLQCLGATYSQSGSSSCTDCPAASYFDIVNFTCRPCNPGYYSTGGTSFCLECPVGAFSPSNSSACSNCLAGSYTGLNASLSCDLCEPATFSSSMGSSSCVLCPDGTFTNESGQPECLECTNGTYSSQGSIQVSTP